MVHVRLLGELEVEAGGKRIEPPASRRAWSLLAWLALHPGEHPRSAVAAAFWPDVLDSSRARLAAQRRRGRCGARSAPPPTARSRAGATGSALRCETDLARFDAHVAAGRLEAAAGAAAGRCSPTSTRTGCSRRATSTRIASSAVLARLADQAATPQRRRRAARAGAWRSTRSTRPPRAT